MIEKPDKNQYVDQSAADDIVKINQQMIVVFEIKSRNSVDRFMQNSRTPPEGKRLVRINFTIAHNAVRCTELRKSDMKHPLFSNSLCNGKTACFKSGKRNFHLAVTQGKQK